MVFYIVIINKKLRMFAINYINQDLKSKMKSNSLIINLTLNIFYHLSKLIDKVYSFFFLYSQFNSFSYKENKYE